MGLCCLLLLAVNAMAQQRTENLVIVTLDGMRWQEVFKGADTALINNKQYTKDIEGTDYLGTQIAGICSPRIATDLTHPVAIAK